MLDQAHIHLLLNHLPVLGAAFGLLLFASGLAKASRDLKGAGLVTFVLVALATIPVYLTGEPAEEVVEGLPGVSEDVIGPHEDSAQLAFIAAGVLGAVALAGLVVTRRKDSFPRPLAVVTLVLSLAVAALMARTANFGGRIRHTEVRGDSLPAPDTAKTP